MAAFEFVALDSLGKQKKGVLEGDSPRQIRGQLRDKGWTPLKVDQTAEKKAGFEVFKSKGPAISVKDLALFTRQLSTLIAAGLPVEESLKAAGEQTEKNKIKSMILAIRSKVLEGFSLANALAEYPKAFPHLYRATVSAGEHAGHLDLVLNRLADYLEQTHESNAKLKMAALYPIILFVVATAMVIGLLNLVVPKVVGVFQKKGEELPGITQFVIDTNDFIGAFWLHILILIAATFFAFSRALQNPKFRKSWHLFVLKIPLIGKFTRNANTARFASTLAILQSSSVPLVDAMKIAAEVVTNIEIKEKLIVAYDDVSKGGSLAKAMEESKQFPPMMLHMVASGEQSGELESMLEKTAHAQQKDLETTVSALVKMFEPLMLVVMGGIVFTIVVAMMLPIVSMNQMVG